MAPQQLDSHPRLLVGVYDSSDADKEKFANPKKFLGSRCCEILIEFLSARWCSFENVTGQPFGEPGWD